MRAVYDELHNTLMAIDEHEDLRWWKNTHGPGMPTDWPHFQVFQSNPFLLLRLIFGFRVLILIVLFSGMDT